MNLSELFTAAPYACLNNSPPGGAQSLEELQNILGTLPSGLGAVAVGTLYLRHGHLETAHIISQDISSPYVDRLHAIMHRKEGDYSNSRYWCIRAGGNELYSHIDDEFSPQALTNQVEALNGVFDSTAAERAKERQNRELTVLFQYCSTAG